MQLQQLAPAQEKGAKAKQILPGMLSLLGHKSQARESIKKLLCAMVLDVWHKASQVKAITKGGLKASSPVRFAADEDHRFT